MKLVIREVITVGDTYDLRIVISVLRTVITVLMIFITIGDTLDPENSYMCLY